MAAPASVGAAWVFLMSDEYKYSRASGAVLVTVHPKLRQLFQAVLPYYDHTLLRGVRLVKQQQEYVRQGLSKTMDSRHLPGGGIDPKLPEFPELSYAIDVAPFIGGKVSYEHRHVAHFAGYVLATSNSLNIQIRWGGDWNSDKDQTDSTFWDGVHFELKRGVHQ